MALLVLLDTGGPELHLADQTLPLDLAGLHAVGLAAAGRLPTSDALDALAEAHGGDAAELRTLLHHLRAVEHPDAPLALVDEPTPVPVAPPPATDYDAELLLQTRLPQPVVVTADGFAAWPTASAPAEVLDADQVALLGCFAMPTRPSSLGPDRQPGNPLLATEAARDAAVAELCARGLVGEEISVPYRTGWERGKATTRRIHHRTRALVAQQAALLESRPPRAGRVPVFGVERAANTRPPVALGLLFAAAEAHDDGALTALYDFVPDWHVRPASVRRAVADGPAVFLFSNYVWSQQGNLAISAKVKELSPNSLVIHGGPNTPKFPGDREQYFADHPSVDVVVHGEGEATICEVLEVVGGRLDGDLRALGDVAGITFRPRPGEAPVTTAERDRIADLDTLPSPYLTGVFDAWRHASIMVTIESNRGCPYGCTFCDWGSATNSRIRKFDLQRVFDEITWAAEAEVPLVMIADANFGIFERDVEIARFIAESKERCGFPDRMLTNYAKNTVKHLEPIVTILSDAKLDVNGIMSVQSFDEDVLRITKRKNLKSSEFERLAARFREQQMPMLSDVMIGLPGSTLATTRSDLQGIMEHEVNANIHATQLLPNSPMNEPSYREEWEIVTDEDAVLISTASYSSEDREEMDRIVDSFHAAETFGLLRQVLRWLAVRVDVREIDALEALRLRAVGDPGTYPLMAYVLTSFLDTTTPPGTWSTMLDEVGRLLEAEWGIGPDDPEWVTMRTLQLHVLPERGRTFPDVVDLDHDAVAFLKAAAAARKEGTRPPALSTYGPTTIEVTDPHGTCDTLGTRHTVTDHHSFELAWPLARHIAYRWSPD